MPLPRSMRGLEGRPETHAPPDEELQRVQDEALGWWNMQAARALLWVKRKVRDFVGLTADVALGEQQFKMMVHTQHVQAKQFAEYRRYMVSVLREREQEAEKLRTEIAQVTEQLRYYVKHSGILAGLEDKRQNELRRQAEAGSAGVKVFDLPPQRVKR